MILLQDALRDLQGLANAWGPFLLLLASSVLVGWGFEKLVIRALKRAVARTRSELDDVIVKAVHPALLLAVVIGTIWFGLRYLGTGVPAPVIEATATFSQAAIILLGSFVLARLVHGSLHFRARARADWAPVARLGSRLSSLLIYVLAFLVILAHYGISITPLVTSLGIAGLAVALALQDTLTNFFAGIWIQTGRHLRPGHYVKLPDQNLEGYVVEIGWRTSQIRQLANNLIVIPNSKLAQSVVIDYHLPIPRMSLLIPVSVGYESDPNQIERLLIDEALQAADDVPGLLKEPAPFVRFIPGFGAYSLDFTLICQVREFVDQYLAQHELRKRILERFRREGVRIPYPIRETLAVPATRGDVGSPPDHA